MNNDIMRFNKLKINELSKKIMECNGDYRLMCIDVDDVVYNTAPLVQEIIKRIDYRASNEYRANISKEASADFRDGIAMSYTILDAILEERTCSILNERGQIENLDFRKPFIDYETLYSTKNLFPLAYEHITNMLKDRRPNDFIIFLSHRNPERESEIKTKKLYELFPEIDAVVTLPFHAKVGATEMNDKGAFIQQTLLLENLDNCVLIDNTKKNCTNWRLKNGLSIRYLPEGFNSTHTLSDRMSKLVSLDPIMIEFCINYILYSRQNPEYSDLIDSREIEPVKVKKLK